MVLNLIARILDLSLRAQPDGFSEIDACGQEQIQLEAIWLTSLILSFSRFTGADKFLLPHGRPTAIRQNQCQVTVQN